MQEDAATPEDKGLDGEGDVVMGKGGGREGNGKGKGVSKGDFASTQQNNVGSLRARNANDSVERSEQT